MKSLAIIVLVSVACCSQKTQKVEYTSDQKDSSQVLTILGHNDDYPIEYYDEQCKRGLSETIKAYWKFDNATNIYKTNLILINQVVSGTFSCLIKKDTNFVSSLFGNNSQNVIFKPIDGDSITLIRTYVTDICKLNFYFKNGNSLIKINYSK